jgi:hypothetical protein
MTPKKPEWFELTDGENSPANVRKLNKKLPIMALAATALVIVAGSIFANANDESSASADTPNTVQSAAPTVSASPSSSATGANSLPVPTVSNIPQRGDGDHDGRERGDHRDGDHHDGDGFEHDND